MIRSLYLYLCALACFSMLLSGCGTTGTVVLPPQLCIPATDLPETKAVKVLPEVETDNSAFYELFLTERADHAKDVQDYNSLWTQCVKGDDHAQ